MYLVGKVLSEEDFINLVVDDAEYCEFVKSKLDGKLSDNKILSSKLDNLDDLKAKIGVNYSSSKRINLFED